jgi:Sensors of blue-light using FAD
MLERIVTVSRVSPGVGLADVHAIIRSAHAHNGAWGLSGALVVLDGWFAQILEGPAGPLGAALARIAADARHSELALRIRTPALAPLFRGQPLALRHRGCLPEGLLEAFDYRPGFAVATFPADVLTEFLIAACRRRMDAARLPGRWTSPPVLPTDEAGFALRSSPHAT